MKANAPYKIYIQPNAHDGWFETNNLTESLTEYIRTDVFIEKAVQYLKDHKDEVETEDNGIAGWIPDYFIEDFKKYMEL